MYLTKHVFVSGETGKKKKKLERDEGIMSQRGISDIFTLETTDKYHPY